MRGLYYTSPRRLEHKPCSAVMRTKRAEASELTFAPCWTGWHRVRDGHGESPLYHGSRAAPVSVS